MIYIITALYEEALPFITKLNLKKNNDFNRFSVFENKEFVLGIVGVGKVKSAIGATFVLSKYKIKKEDLIINFGICGAKQETGEAFFCDKIIDADTNYCYYPEMIFRIPFESKCIETHSKYFKGDIENLVDMEASALYQVFTYFFKSYQVYFIKIVSDCFNDDTLDKNLIKNIINIKLEQIINWSLNLSRELNNKEKILTASEEQLIDVISDNLKLTTSYKEKLKRMAFYYKIQNGNLDILNEFKKLESFEKKEVKKNFLQLREKLIE